MMTIRAYIKQKNKEAALAGREEGAVRFLVFERLGLDLTTYTLHAERVLSLAETLSLDKDLEAYIKKNIPVQYILGYTYFLGTRYKVGPGVLIPRFDTEVLALESERIIAERGFKRIVEIGTGSGAIALYLKSRFPSISITATDISAEALSYAQLNAHELKRDVEFIEADILDGLSGPFDFIISNPPYIAINDTVDDIVRLNEPLLALYAAESGLAIYYRILKEAKKVLSDDGVIAFEIAPERESGIREFARGSYEVIDIKRDNAGRNRVMVLERREA